MDSGGASCIRDWRVIRRGRVDIVGNPRDRIQCTAEVASGRSVTHSRRLDIGNAQSRLSLTFGQSLDSSQYRK
uniref:Uncharacterized protein n=1 Tax=Pristionchus pacificus TaxID=54126 RepID=A0A2A6B891_PRIPA|eukprot:PDM62077.1 hypothetical protein PRIPAC_51519 [Pristionchus pacificus]